METLTDQQKLEILCAYLPHGVEMESDKIYKGFRTKLVVSNFTNSFKNGLTIASVSTLDYEVKLILRHPDDMTDLERLQKSRLWAIADETERYTDIHKALNYLHSLHIDTFGAIEAGFAVRKEVGNG